MPETLTADHWRCRVLGARGDAVTASDCVGLLQRLADSGLDFIKSEGLFSFDGELGFTRGQGQ